jgi:hypothetical protein
VGFTFWGGELGCWPANFFWLNGSHGGVLSFEQTLSTLGADPQAAEPVGEFLQQLFRGCGAKGAAEGLLETGNDLGVH